jgi:hypothetical protein
MNIMKNGKQLVTEVIWGNQIEPNARVCRKYPNPITLNEAKEMELPEAQKQGVPDIYPVSFTPA